VKDVAAVPVGIVAPLAAWYARAKRDLPWRRSRDPYRVWVSEIMLQQTQVERVKEYFARFMERFPALEDLAAAREEDVLRQWEGLGYYRRARQIHAAARRLVAEHAGRFPRSVDRLRELPGIGRYTAGAIASIAFDEPAPVVEANSRRVIARLVAHDRPLTGAAGDAPIWRIAEALVPKRHPGRFNQALMDLGAMVCTPQRPLCTRCPLERHCLARRSRRVDSIPVQAPRRQPLLLRETAIVLRRRNSVLLERRGAGEWWEGLWDFPRQPAAGRATGRKLGVVTYTVTHHKVTCTVVERAAPASGPAKAAKARSGRWIQVAKLGSLPLSAPGRRIARLLLEKGVEK
jgi:A/G-specific adenine glycosylase